MYRPFHAHFLETPTARRGRSLRSSALLGRALPRRLAQTCGAACAVLAVPGLPAETLAAPDCNASGNPDLACRLTSYLHALYVIAGVLGAILLLVILIAVAVYRKNRNTRSRLP